MLSRDTNLISTSVIWQELSGGYNGHLPVFHLVTGANIARPMTMLNTYQVMPYLSLSAEVSQKHTTS